MTWGDDALKEKLIADGYHKGTMEDALNKAMKGQIEAAKRLGRDPNSILDAPAEGQDVSEWMKKNGKAFGIPDSVDGYELKLPENLPEGMPVDDKMLNAFKKSAADMGMPAPWAQGVVDMYTGQMSEMFSSLAEKQTQAELALDTALKEQWGAQHKENTEKAKRTFQMLASEFGMDADRARTVASVFDEKAGSPAMLDFMHKLSVKLGDDTVFTPEGGNAPAMQLADAEQRKAAIMTDFTGDMAKAVHSGNQAQVKALKEELKGLNNTIASYKGT